RGWSTRNACAGPGLRRARGCRLRCCAHLRSPPRAFAEDAHFATALAVKDLELATAAIELPAVEGVLTAYRCAVEEGGLAEADLARAADRLRTTARTRAHTAVSPTAAASNDA
ncbi:hypothetical protein ABT317_45600, partial [Streptomyces carpinensis]